MPLTGVSIIICCYNSGTRLPQTLKHLAAQQVEKDVCWEVILVNNASSDNTVEVAHAEWAQYQLPDVLFTIACEDKPGLSHAREKGIQTARFDTVIFCDDDNWLDKSYVGIAFRVMANNGTIGALGGQSIPVADVALPDWFEAAKNNYAVGQQATTSGDVTLRTHLWGCGLVIRRSLYIKAFAGFPSILTGRKEGEQTSGEDSELCMRFILMGYRLYYSEELKLHHYIPQARLSPKYNEKLMDGFIAAYRLLNIYNRLIELRSASFLQKYVPAVRSLARVALGKLAGLKRWNLYDEELTVYLASGFKSSAISQDIISIKEFEKKCNKQRADNS